MGSKGKFAEAQLLNPLHSSGTFFHQMRRLSAPPQFGACFDGREGSAPAELACGAVRLIKGCHICVF